MSQLNRLSRRSTNDVPRLRTVGTSCGPACPFWFDARDTPWSMVARSQVAAASLIDGRGSMRTWRFAATRAAGMGLRERTSSHRVADALP